MRKQRYRLHYRNQHWTYKKETTESENSKKELEQVTARYVELCKLWSEEGKIKEIRIAITIMGQDCNKSKFKLQTLLHVFEEPEQVKGIKTSHPSTPQQAQQNKYIHGCCEFFIYIYIYIYILQKCEDAIEHINKLTTAAKIIEIQQQKNKQLSKEDTEVKT